MPPPSAAGASDGHGAADSDDPRPARSREPVLLDNASLVIREAGEQYLLGEEAFRSGDLERARAHFDAAVLAFFKSGVSIDEEPRLQEAYLRIVQDIQMLEGEALADAGDEKGETEAPFLDELKDIRSFLTPEELALEMEKVRPPSEADHFSIPVVLNDRVLTLIEAFQTHFRKAFVGGYQRMGRYEEMIRQTLREEGVPEDLLYVAFTESTYKPNAYSRARAKGIWQFMSSTGARYGLVRNAYIDERSDPEKSTRAAARYFKDLYAMFGDWYLAMAAYNAGEGLILRAMERTGKKDFWELAQTRYLKPETKNFVPSILALSIMSRDPARYGHPGLVKDAPYRYDKVALDGATDLGLIARLTGSSVQEIRDLNPQIMRSMTPPGYRSYEIRVPAGRGEAFQTAYASLPAAEKIAPVRATYKVRKGETLASIARKFGTSATALAEANGLSSGAKLSTGMTVLVPGGVEGGSRATTTARGSSVAGEDGRYVVRRGDTLSDIARRHRTTVAKIASLNGLSERSVLMPGQVLQVRGNAAPRTASVKTAQVRSTSGTASKGAQEPAAGSQQKVTHRVRAGENLFRIAQKYGTTVESIQSLNQLGRGARIYPGDVLTVIAR